MTQRLSPLDASFLHVESASAHMHVAWKGRFEPDPRRPPVTFERVVRLVGSRLGHVPRLRQRLAFPPGGFGAPVWVDDAEFRLDRHVLRLGAEEPLSPARFDRLVDGVLSVPLDRRRPLWEIHVAPQIADGSVGVVMKVHHAMVDGLSAVALSMLLLDVDPDAEEPGAERAAGGWTPRRAPGAGRLAISALADAGMTPLRAAERVAREGGGIAGSIRRAALSVGEDVLRPAPGSYLNASLGPRRTLLGHAADLGALLEARERHDATLNDVALAVVAGTLRQLALARGTMPTRLKAMVPVARRAPDAAAALGNRIAFVSVTLPVHEPSAARRVASVREQTRAFKSGGRAAGGEVVLDALGLLPPILQARAARLAASPRAYNLVVSNVPGPRMPVYLLGARGTEAYPVIPLSERHTLSIGIFSLHERLCFGAYADPDALPEVGDLPAALSAAVLEMMRGSGRRMRAA